MKIENIKFKAKKTLDGKWIKGDLVHHKDSDNVRMTDFEKRLTSPITPSTICQFTGLKNCKDNEIFEHDLIHFVGHKPIGEVIWSEEDYAFMIASENEPLYWLSDVLEIGKIERVGNKFDRKEGEK